MGLDPSLRGVLCLVTDRHRLSARLGRTVDSLNCLVEQVAAAAAAGVHLVLVRERDLPARELLGLVADCVSVTGGTRARVVVNDRVDVALAAGAAGVHLRGDSVPSGLVRAIAPEGFLVGRSVHAVEEAIGEAAAGAVDYLVMGTMFPTASKPAGAFVVGPDALQRVTDVVALPVLGIGGVTLAKLPALARAGAAGFAAIGWFIDAYCSAGPERTFVDRISEVRRLFDTPRSMP